MLRVKQDNREVIVLPENMRHFRTIPNFIEMTDDEILSLPENRDNDIWAGWGLFWLDKLLTRKINPGKHVKLVRKQGWNR